MAALAAGGVAAAGAGANAQIGFVSDIDDDEEEEQQQRDDHQQPQHQQPGRRQQRTGGDKPRLKTEVGRPLVQPLITGRGMYSAHMLHVEDALKQSKLPPEDEQELVFTPKINPYAGEPRQPGAIGDRLYADALRIKEERKQRAEQLAAARREAEVQETQKTIGVKPRANDQVFDRLHSHAEVQRRRQAEAYGSEMQVDPTTKQPLFKPVISQRSREIATAAASPSISQPSSVTDALHAEAKHRAERVEAAARQQTDQHAGPAVWRMSRIGASKVYDRCHRAVLAAMELRQEEEMDHHNLTEQDIHAALVALDFIKAGESELARIWVSRVWVALVQHLIAAGVTPSGDAIPALVVYSFFMHILVDFQEDVGIPVLRWTKKQLAPFQTLKMNRLSQTPRPHTDTPAESFDFQPQVNPVSKQLAAAKLSRLSDPRPSPASVSSHQHPFQPQLSPKSHQLAAARLAKWKQEQQEAQTSDDADAEDMFAGEDAPRPAASQSHADILRAMMLPSHADEPYSSAPYNPSSAVARRSRTGVQQQTDSQLVTPTRPQQASEPMLATMPAPVEPMLTTFRLTPPAYDVSSKDESDGASPHYSEPSAAKPDLPPPRDAEPQLTTLRSQSRHSAAGVTRSKAAYPEPHLATINLSDPEHAPLSMHDLGGDAQPLSTIPGVIEHIKRKQRSEALRSLAEDAERYQPAQTSAPRSGRDSPPGFYQTIHRTRHSFIRHRAHGTEDFEQALRSPEPQVDLTKTRSSLKLAGDKDFFWRTRERIELRRMRKKQQEVEERQIKRSGSAPRSSMSRLTMTTDVEGLTWNETAKTPHVTDEQLAGPDPLPQSPTLGTTPLVLVVEMVIDASQPPVQIPVHWADNVRELARNFLQQNGLPMTLLDAVTEELESRREETLMQFVKKDILLN